MNTFSFLYTINNYKKIITKIKTEEQISVLFSFVQPNGHGTYPELTIKQQNRLVRISLLFSYLAPSLFNRRCLFVSLSIASWLQYNDYLINLNIGITENKNNPTGHCWLSLENGESFCELSNLSKNYKSLLAYKNRIYYWFNGVDN